jgi:hypothetical protein
MRTVGSTVEHQTHHVRLWDVNWGLLVALGSCVAFWAMLVGIVAHLA